jgi:tRNA threonylcarbamoyladenosine biosynthesis protein TsaE
LEEHILISNSVDETKKMAKKLASLFEAGDIISLTGDLGAGKTSFVQGLAQALDITLQIISPTFTLIREYPGKPPLYHFDVYRLKNIQELVELGYEEYFFGEGVCVIEWGDKIRELLPAEHLEIEFRRESENRRKLFVRAYGDKWRNKAKKWVKLCSS